MDKLLDDQIIEPVGYDFGFTRRTFVRVLGTGLLIAVAAPSVSFAQQRRGGGRGQSKPTPLDARIHVGKDGTITVMTGKVEGGQGARHAHLEDAELSEPVGDGTGRAVALDAQPPQQQRRGEERFGRIHRRCPGPCP